MPKQNVFLSSPDPQNDALADFRMALIRQGFNVFTNDGIVPESDLARREISIAECVLVGLTSTSSDDDRFYKELTNAIELQKKIIVVQLEESDIPQRLGKYDVIRLYDDFETGLQLLGIALSGKSLPKAISTPNYKPPVSEVAEEKPATPSFDVKRLDTPIRPSARPLTTTSGTPLSEEPANPTTVVAVMFAIIVIGFVILTNLPTGGGMRGGGATGITERQVSNTLVEYTASNTRFTLPTIWQEVTASAVNSPELRSILGTLDASTTRNVLQMAFRDRETQNQLWVLMSNVASGTTLSELNATLQASPQSQGVTLVESRLRAYPFGDALFVYSRATETVDDPLAYQYMVVTLRNQRMYLILMVSQTDSRATFDNIIRRFEIIN